MKKYILIILISVLVLGCGKTIKNEKPAKTNRKTFTSLVEALKEPEKVYSLSLTRDFSKFQAIHFQRTDDVIRKEWFKELHDCIGEFKNLRKLDLDRNQLNELPKGIGKLKKLKELNLEYNNLKELPKEIEYLKDLERLFLKGNPIEKVPEEIDKIKKLLPDTEIEFLNNNNSDLPPTELEEIE